MILEVLFVVAGILRSTVSQDVASKNFGEANTKFTADVYKNLAVSNPGNFICSPLSAQIILALTSEGAVCRTKTELVTALHLPNERQTEEAIAKLNLNISLDNLKVLSANKLYLGEKFTLEKKFEDVARVIYKAGVQNVEFCNAANSAQTINDWVAQNTNNKIQDLIASNALNCQTRIVLVNTLYFSGQWTTPFKKRLTSKGTFYKTCKSKAEIDMMHSDDSEFTRYKYAYSSKLNAKFLELTYRHTNISMTFILPDQIDGIGGVESNLGEYLKHQNMQWDRVSITLPKFTVTTAINFIPILQKLGVRDLFEPSANLSGISKESGLYVTDVIQKAYIQISENGTEAAAATAVIVGLTGTLEPPPPPALTFNANHPFLYYIRDNSKGIVLFVGRFSN